MYCNYNLTEHVVNYFDNLIINLNMKKSKMSSNTYLYKEFMEDINSLVEIASLLPEKDKTIVLYLDKLKRRMLSNLSVEIEILVMNSLGAYYPEKLIVNINRMIVDKDQNDIDNIDFHQLNNIEENDVISEEDLQVLKEMEEDV